MKLNAVKRFAARAFDLFGVNAVGHFIQRASLFPFIRAVNYHDIPQDRAKHFEDHLAFYSSRFVNVTYQGLLDFLQRGKWPHDKPGIVLSFDDGVRSHYEVAAPLLEKYNFTGWFFVPSGRVIEKNGTRPSIIHEDETLTPTQLLDLDKRHVVGCHTETHCRLSSDLTPDELNSEILTSQKSLEKQLGHAVKTFCWVGGEEYTYSKAAADLIKQGYDLSFMTNSAIIRPDTNPLQLQRTNIEAENPLWLVRFQISGLMDIAYYPKRNRVNKLTQ